MGALPRIDDTLGGQGGDSTLDLYNKIMISNDASLMHRFGHLLEAQDRSRAIALWRRAAELGEVHAMFDVGCALYWTDRAEAKTYFEQGSHLGHVPSMYRLMGLLRLSGDHEYKHWLDALHERDGEVRAYLRQAPANGPREEVMKHLNVVLFRLDSAFTKGPKRSPG